MFQKQGQLGSFAVVTFSSMQFDTLGMQQILQIGKYSSFPDQVSRLSEESMCSANRRGEGTRDRGLWRCGSVTPQPSAGAK